MLTAFPINKNPQTFQVSCDCYLESPPAPKSRRPTAGQEKTKFLWSRFAPIKNRFALYQTLLYMSTSPPYPRATTTNTPSVGNYSNLPLQFYVAGIRPRNSFHSHSPYSRTAILVHNANIPAPHFPRHPYRNYKVLEPICATPHHR